MVLIPFWQIVRDVIEDSCMTLESEPQKPLSLAYLRSRNVSKESRQLLKATQQLSWTFPFSMKYYRYLYNCSRSNALKLKCHDPDLNTWWGTKLSLVKGRPAWLELNYSGKTSNISKMLARLPRKSSTHCLFDLSRTSMYSGTQRKQMPLSLPKTNDVLRSLIEFVIDIDKCSQTSENVSLPRYLPKVIPRGFPL